MLRRCYTPPRNDICYRKGFTLAEVLLVITIIGVVASLTLPNLISSVQKQQYVAGVKKAQSTLSQAYTLFIADDTTMDEIFAGDSQYVTALNRFITKLNVIKNCGNGSSGQHCFPDYYELLNGNPYVLFEAATAILADGSSIVMIDNAGGCDNHVSVTSSNPLYNTCGSIYIDINGYKSPNQLGRDLFFFRITRTGVIPYGAYDGTACVITGSGTGCASKILLDGDMKY